MLVLHFKKISAIPVLMCSLYSSGAVCSFKKTISGNLHVFQPFFPLKSNEHVNPWLIQVNVWHKPLQYCKIISLQLIKINAKAKKKKSNEQFLGGKMNKASVLY